MSDVATAPERAARAVVPPKNAETITVACKLPNGLVLHTFEERTVREQMFGGGTKEVKQWYRSEESYTLNGGAMSIDAVMNGSAHTIIGGYALTYNVPTEFWERWLEQNKHTLIVKNGFVFANKAEDSVRDQARDGSKLRTGFEPVNPDDPASASPEFRRIRKGSTNRGEDDDAGM